MSKDLGMADAYAFAVSKGYTGTREEFAELMASYAHVAEEAQEAREGAEAAQTGAETAEGNAQGFAQTASEKASQASQSASQASGSASTASEKAQVATTKASEASQSATVASNKASEASTSAQTAVTAKNDAVTAKTGAETARTQAQTAKTQAETAKTGAETAQGLAEDARDSAQATAQDISEHLTQIDTNTEDIAEINETLERKANIDGYYEDMGVGNAEQLISTQYLEDKIPYHFRTSGGSLDIGNREEDMLVGGSIVWNQLCNGTSVTLQSGHKYISKIGAVWTVETSTGTAITGLTSGSDMITDLTTMFGTEVADYIYGLEQATAGAGVAWFKKLFPKDYYEYNAGELMHVEGVSVHKMVGFNQWDEEWELGTINTSNGNKGTSTASIRNKNDIRVFPNTQYYLCVNASTNTIVYFYTKDLIFISASGGKQNSVFLTPSNCYWLRFVSTETSNKSICINLSDPSRNGEYEPYVKHTYLLDGTLILRGIPKIDVSGNLYYDGDTYESDGTVTRKYGIVDLGTLTWVYDTAWGAEGYMNTFRAVPSIPIFDRASGYLPNMLCSKYSVIDANTMYRGTIDKSITQNAQHIRIRDTAYTDATVFKSAMSGVMLIYELATPTIEVTQPYQNPQIVDNWGTEEYVTDSIVPIGHDTKYPQDLRAKLEHLPSLADSEGNYIIQQSGGNMSLTRFRIPQAPTENGTYVLKATVSGGTPTYTWEAENEG